MRQPPQESFDLKRRALLRLGTLVTAVTGASTISALSTGTANAAGQMVTAEPVTPNPDAKLGPNAWKIDPAVARLTPSQQTAYFQKLFADIAAFGGVNVVEGGAQHFTVARENTTVTGLKGMEVLFVIPANTTFSVQDGFTIELDPSTPRHATGLLMFQTGAMTEGGSAALKGATIVTNNETIGSGSIWAWGNRRPENYLVGTNNLVVDGATFRDARVAVTNARQSPAAALKIQDKNWRLTNGHVEKCNNRAIELSQLDGALVANWVMRDVETAIHILGYSKNIRIRNIDATTRNSALWINYGCEDIDIDGLNLRVAEGCDPTEGTLEFHSEPAPATYSVRNIRLRNGRLGISKTGTHKRSLTFMLTAGATNVLWEDIKIKSFEFDGDVVVAPAINRSAGETRNVRFEDCDFHANLVNIPTSEYNAHDFTFLNCNFTSSINQTINADRFRFINCTFAAAPEISSAANQTYMKNCTTPTEIINNGMNSQLVGNDLLFAAPIITAAKASVAELLDPTAIERMTVWDANTLAAGLWTSWPPHAGAPQAINFLPMAAAPTVIDAAMNGHKVIRFDATKQHRITSSPFASAIAQPYTLIQVYKVSANSLDMNLLGGLSNNQPIIRRTASGEVLYRANAAGPAVAPPAPYPTPEAAHVNLVEFNAGTSKFFMDTLFSRPSVGSLAQVDALSGIRFGSSGTGNPPYFNGDLQLIAFYPGILPVAQRSAVIRFLCTKVGTRLVE